MPKPSGFILGCGIPTIFSRSQILAQCETVPHPKFVKEMSETHAYPLNAVNTPVFNEKQQCFPWKKNVKYGAYNRNGPEHTRMGRYNRNGHQN